MHCALAFELMKEGLDVEKAGQVIILRGKGVQNGRFCVQDSCISLAWFL